MICIMSLLHDEFKIYNSGLKVLLQKVACSYKQQVSVVVCIIYVEKFI